MDGYDVFGPGSGSVWTLGLICDGSEENILDCIKYDDYGTFSHSYDVGIICGESYSSNTNACIERKGFHRSFY